MYPSHTILLSLGTKLRLIGLGLQGQQIPRTSALTAAEVWYNVHLLSLSPSITGRLASDAQDRSILPEALTAISAQLSNYTHPRHEQSSLTKIRESSRTNLSICMQCSMQSDCTLIKCSQKIWQPGPKIQMHIIETDEHPLCVLMSAAGWVVPKSLSGITEELSSTARCHKVMSDQLKKETTKL